MDSIYGYVGGLLGISLFAWFYMPSGLAGYSEAMLRRNRLMMALIALASACAAIALAALWGLAVAAGWLIVMSLGSLVVTVVISRVLHERVATPIGPEVSERGPGR